MLFHGWHGRIFRRFCCLDLCCGNQQSKRLDKLIKNGEDRYYKEMDIVNIVNTIRLFKVFFTMKFPPEQRMLLKLQTSQVIKSGSEDDHDEVWDQDHEFL